MTYLDIEVTNTGNITKVRAGHIFPPGETVTITVRPADLPEIQACVGLSVKVSQSYHVHPSDIVETPKTSPTPLQKEKKGEDATPDAGETDATVETVDAEPEQEQDEPKRRGKKGRR